MAILVQTLENQPTAGFAWAPFGDVILKRTLVTLDESGRMELRRRAVPFMSDYREGAVISGVTGGGPPGSRALGTGEQRRG
jgi:hypothetical protein